jgi:allophanate hydrolase subunit 2
VQGGIAVDPVLGSRSTDTLSGLGPPPLRPDDQVPIGADPGPAPAIDLAPVLSPPHDEIELRMIAGPRADWFADSALGVLCSGPYQVQPDSDRVGMRLVGPALLAERHDELPSEGVVPGALQVPPSGAPVLFLADHPVTGGYPVLAVVLDADVDRAAQARPGQRLRFRRVPAPRL